MRPCPACRQWGRLRDGTRVRWLTAIALTEPRTRALQLGGLAMEAYRDTGSRPELNEGSGLRARTTGAERMVPSAPVTMATKA